MCVNYFTHGRILFFLERCGAMLQIRGYGHFTDDDVADVAQLAMAGLIQQSANPRRLFALPTGCPGDPEQQSRS
jgi:hypothetical protein